MPDRIDDKTRNAVTRFLSLVSSNYEVVDAILYGSRARGDHDDDSDADVAVILKQAHLRVLPTTLDLASTAYDVMLETGVNISPMPIWIDEWENPTRHSNPGLVKIIASEGVRV